MHIQKSVKGGRKKLSPSVLKEINYEVERLARKYNVSKSWVVSVVLADAFGIRKQEKYK
jgi:Mor family transcriptional regulator